MAEANVCKNCAHAKKKRGTLFCSLLKQKVNPNHTCGKFKPK